MCAYNIFPTVWCNHTLFVVVRTHRFFMAPHVWSSVSSLVLPVIVFWRLASCHFPLLRDSSVTDYKLISTGPACHRNVPQSTVMVLGEGEPRMNDSPGRPIAVDCGPRLTNDMWRVTRPRGGSFCLQSERLIRAAAGVKQRGQSSKRNVLSSSRWSPSRHSCVCEGERGRCWACLTSKCCFYWVRLLHILIIFIW